MTVAKALTSAYVPMGGLIASDRVAEPFMHGNESFAHGLTFAGHPVAAAVAMANLDVFEREDICGHVLRKEGELRGMLDSLRDIPIVGDVRGDGFFHAIELVKDQDTKEGFTRRGVGVAPARLPLGRALPPRPDLPGRRPRRPGGPACAHPDLRHRAVRGDRERAAPGAHRGLEAGQEGD